MSYLSQMKLLYIEDEEETREALEHYLKRRCSRIFCAPDAESGLELFQMYQPDIVLVDLILPGMNGTRFIETIREQGAKTPVLITTTVSETETITNSIEQGISAYIIKPVKTGELEEKLEQIAVRVYQSQLSENRKAFYGQDKDKGPMAEEIRVGFLKLLKAKSGKGPTKVDVRLEAEAVEIFAYDTLTAFERTIAAHHRNYSLVEHGRDVFYKSIGSDIQQLVFQKTGVSFHLESVQIHIQRKVDILRLTID